MRLNINSLANADLQTLSLLSDTFEKKVGDWAYASHYLSTSSTTEEPYGRFSMQPIDAPVMKYVEERMQEVQLPTGHLYDHALQQSIDDLKNHPQADALLALLEEDVALRHYFKKRQMEWVSS